jgi:RsiW-degrading membrane proteinase PrsW (M82 family)
MLGLLGWGLGGNGGSRREIVAGMAGGGCLGMAISLVGEILVLVAVIVIIVIVAMATPDGLERMSSLSEQMQDPAWQADITNIAEFVLSPIVIASVLGAFCIPVPIVEETSKVLAGGVTGGWVRPLPARAFAWGVAAGAGFALAENLFNGAVGGVEGWVVGAVLRIGTTAMHCFASGLVG